MGKQLARHWTRGQGSQIAAAGRLNYEFAMYRDGKYGQAVPVSLQNLGVKVVRTAPRSPWQNPYVERFGGTLRRELLDKIIVFNQRQLHRIVREFVTYYHQGRCHLGLEKDAPEPRAVTPRPIACARVIAQPRVGGLQHRYEWRQAA